MINDFGSNEWIKGIKKTDNLLIKCCYIYFCEDNEVDKKNLLKSLEGLDLNDYKNVSALAYLYMANLDVELSLIEGINRISSKSIKSSKLLIADEMAILALVLVIKLKHLNQYDSWLQQIVNAHSNFVNDMEYDEGFSNALDEFIKNNNNISLEMSDYYTVTKIWLEKEKDNIDNTIELQEKIAQKIWLNMMPYFNNNLFDLIACGIIKNLISKKFDSGIVSIEKKFEKANKKAERTAK